MRSFTAQSFDVPELEDFTVPIGKARVARAGKDVTIVTWSIGMTYALKAADELGQGGDRGRGHRPAHDPAMDTETIIASVKKTGRCVTVEEGWAQSGVGAEIVARIMEQAFDYLDAPVLRVSGKDVPMPYAANLEKLALPNVGESSKLRNASATASPCGTAQVAGRQFPQRPTCPPIF